MKGVAFTGGGTGGHLYPLIAVAEQLKKQDPTLALTFFGSDSRMEVQAVPAAGFDFVGLPVISVPRRPGPGMVRALGKLWTSYRQALSWLRLHRPKVVVGAGGYISVPLVLAAARERVPVVLLEQNADPGMATKFLAPLARLVCVSFEASAGHFRNAVWTGNPLREGIGRQPRQPGKFDLDRKRPTLVVMGGSLGARRVNQVMAEIAGRIIHESDWQVVHLTGEGGYEAAQAALIDEGLGESARYKVLPYCHEMPALLAIADLAIARAGATSVAELALAKIPAIYIPYPGAGHHQAANAKASVAAGAAKMVLEADLSADSLWETIKPLLADQKSRLAMASACATIAMPGAAKAITQQIIALLKGTEGTPNQTAQEGKTA